MSKVTYRAAIYCNEQPINSDGHCFLKKISWVVLPSLMKGKGI